jgi:Fic family protein
LSHSPLLCDPSEKPQREADNAVKQIKYISHLVNEQGIVEIRESQVLLLHEFTVEGIYPCAGQYRQAGQLMRISGSAHVPPSVALVRGLVLDLVDDLNVTRNSMLAIDRAAYALWRLNWIHPFLGGNGRTARALSYLVICIDLGSVPTGMPQMPATIADRGDEYDLALKAADCRNLGPITALVEAAITLQLDNASERPRGHA